MTIGPQPGRRKVIGDEGDLSVFVADEQAEHPVDTNRWSKLAEHVLAAEGVRGNAELTILFVDETAMAELNTQFMGEEGATDVLAFPIDDELSGEPGRHPDGGTSGPERSPVDVSEIPLLLGDVVICPAVGARNAPQHAGTYDDEIALLVVHGILHVLGWDHVGPEETAKMQARERQLLDSFDTPASGGEGRP